MKKIMITIIAGLFSVALYSTDSKEPAKPAVKSNTSPAVKPAATTKPVDKQKTTVISIPTGKKVEKDVLSYESYMCPKCKKESQKQMKCPKCKMEYVKVMKSYTYSCKKCGYSSEKIGNCPICKIPLKKNEVTYRCVPDNICEAAPGKCPKCGQALKKHLEPIKSK